MICPHISLPCNYSLENGIGYYVIMYFIFIYILNFTNEHCAYKPLENLDFIWPHNLTNLQIYHWYLWLYIALFHVPDRLIYGQCPKFQLIVPSQLNSEQYRLSELQLSRTEIFGIILCIVSWDKHSSTINTQPLGFPKIRIQIIKNLCLAGY